VEPDAEIVLNGAAGEGEAFGLAGNYEVDGVEAQVAVLGVLGQLFEGGLALADPDDAGVALQQPPVPEGQLLDGLVRPETVLVSNEVSGEDDDGVLHVGAAPAPEEASQFAMRILLLFLLLFEMAQGRREFQPFQNRPPAVLPLDHCPYLPSCLLSLGLGLRLSERDLRNAQSPQDIELISLPNRVGSPELYAF
jgi:hypothetical protein